MTDELPGEVLEFLVRTVPTGALWQWLNNEAQNSLRFRVLQGFRANAESLRQPVVRARLVAHLQNSQGDSATLLNLWGERTPAVLAAVGKFDDTALLPELPSLQSTFGREALTLALLHEERESVLEMWIEQEENEDEPSQAEPVPVTSTHDERIEDLRKKLRRVETKLEEVRTKSRELKTQSTASDKALKDKLRAREVAAREAQSEARQHQLRVELLEEKLSDVEKARDRAERKSRRTQSELETGQAETRTLRKQLHRLQQVNEELRSRLAAATEQQRSKREQVEVKTESKPSENQGSTRHLDQPGSSAQQNQKSDAFKIRAAIDRNDEAFVATLRQDLISLRARDRAAYNRILKELRESGNYYARVLTTPMARVFVDASNVARYVATAKGRVEYLCSLREELRRHDFFPIILVADASLPYNIDQPQKLREMIADGEVLVTASGQEADEILAREAKQTGAYVVTNDRNFHFAFAPDFSPSRIGFRIEDGVVLLEEFL